MENNYQEKILSHYDGYGVIKDCFAISRIRQEIMNMRIAWGSNRGTPQIVTVRISELNEILAKYPNAVEQIKI